MNRQLLTKGARLGGLPAACTLALMAAMPCQAAEPAGAKKAEAVSQQSAKSAKSQFAELPFGITSFGAAIIGDELYVFGGHKGSAHSYSVEEQSNSLLRLKLDKQGEWSEIATGPHLQGLALVAHGNKLYRVGGFAAQNKEGEDHVLVSQSTASSYDPSTKTWKELPALPEARSSHDAAVIGDTLYVAGGWALAGKDESKWHDTAYSMDLTSDNPQWQALPKPGFRRRALALAAHDGKLYAIGGMQEKGGPSTQVDIYDPASKKWTKGPELQGEPMEGFGCSAFEVDGRLYASTIHGRLQRLSKDGSKWEVADKLADARFFHRMLPYQNQLLMVGGANMRVGKYTNLELVPAK